MLTTVSNSDGLVAALKTAHSGDTIQLASGVYSPFAVRGLHLDGPVTITSQDPGNQAVLTGFNLRDIDGGLTIKNLELTVDPAKADNPFIVMGSKDIHLDHLNVHGSLDGNPQNDRGALLIRTSTDVSVTNSEFHEVYYGVQHLDDTNITISGNTFHDIRMDGIRGGGSSHVTISQNTFTNFAPVAGDHGDAIQFWTGNTTASAHDINVSDNVVMRGSGGLIQGVFMRDEVGGLPYQNVTITGNLVVGGLGNGIAVLGGNNITISGNQVSGLPDAKSGIRVDNATNVALTNNNASQFTFYENTNLTESGDHVIATAADGGKAMLNAWIQQHAAPAGLTSLVMAGSVTNGIVATITSQISNAGSEAVRLIEATRLKAISLVGTAGADRLTVDGVHDTRVDAGAGNDLLYGGGVGHNTLVGGAGDDSYFVRSDFDTVVEQANGGTDLVSSSVDFELPDNVENLKLTGDATYGAGNELNNKITGGTGDDTLLGFSGADTLQSVEGNDSVSGGEGNDVVYGGAGNDTLTGDAGADKIDGDEGNDSLVGGDGADTIEGGAGIDVFSGGKGADVFLFRDGDFGAKADRIVDFSAADGDKISLTAIDAKSGTVANENFTFIGTQSFHKIAGELRYEVSGGAAHIMGDTNGDGIADFSFDAVGVSIFKAADFLL